MKLGQEIKFIDYSYKIPKVNTEIYIRKNKFNKNILLIECEGRNCFILKSQVIK